jgi:hypothetical protein
MQTLLTSILAAIAAGPSDLLGFLWDNMGLFGRQWNRAVPLSNYRCGRSM